MVTADRDRRRVGFIVPSPALVTRSEFRRLLPEEVDVLFAEVDVGEATVESNLAMLRRDFDSAVMTLAADTCDVIVQGGVSPSIALGAGHDHELHSRISRLGRTNAVVAMEATLRALKALRARTLAVVTPLSSDMTIKVADYFRSSGFVPATAVGQGLATADDVHHADEAAVAELAQAAFRATPAADCVYIYGGGWPSLGVISALRKDLGVPVMSSNIATAWVLHEMLALPPSSSEIATFAADVAGAKR